MFLDSFISLAKPERLITCFFTALLYRVYRREVIGILGQEKSTKVLGERWLLLKHGTGVDFLRLMSLDGQFCARGE